MWISASYFFKLSLLSFSGLVKKVAMVVGMKVILQMSSIDFHSPKPILLEPLLHVQFASNRNRDLIWHYYLG